MDIKIKKKLVKNWFISLQEIICSEIIKIEKKNTKFKTKEWKRNDSKDEGGGKSRVLENGDILNLNILFLSFLELFFFLLNIYKFF